MSSKKPQQKPTVAPPALPAPAPNPVAQQAPPVAFVPISQPVSAKQKPMLIAKKEDKPQVYVPPIADDMDDELDENLYEDEDGDIDLNNPAMLAQILNSVLGNFLENIDEQGKQTNVVDALLLIRNSIDKQSKCILKLSQELDNFSKKK